MSVTRLMCNGCGHPLAYCDCRPKAECAKCNRLRSENEALRAERDNQRMCVMCGKFRPANEPQDDLPECVGPDGRAACTWDMTPSEAWQYWRKKAHTLRGLLAEACEWLSYQCNICGDGTVGERLCCDSLEYEPHKDDCRFHAVLGEQR